ncbi:MAG: UrcA family protein [Sphingobium sp.]|nr:UrcA family protein [Sphingobium sp.]
MIMIRTAVAVLAALSFAASASAAPNDNPFAKDSTILKLKGLDLSSAEGQQRLAIRMDAAARTVCGDRLASVHLAADAQARECRAQVIADIRDQIEARQAAAATGPRVEVASR